MRAPLRVFVGFDSRQPLAYHVCRSSVERHAHGRVQVEPVRLDWLPISRRGLTEFTFSRYLVPWLCDYTGYALFLDSDIIVRADVREMLDAVQLGSAVSVVQTGPRFEWPSVMLFDCANYRCRILTPEFVDAPDNAPQTLTWAVDRLGSLPPEYNYLVGYSAALETAPKIVHFTAGIPCWPETTRSDYADWWRDEYDAMLHTVSWSALMGDSVHRPIVEAMNR
jgi:lipopolysaccharide biosynthesis glycosyltransferase